MTHADAVKKRGVAKGRFARRCHSVDTAIKQSKPLQFVDLLAADPRVAYDI